MITPTNCTSTVYGASLNYQEHYLRSHLKRLLPDGWSVEVESSLPPTPLLTTATYDPDLKTFKAEISQGVTQDQIQVICQYYDARLTPGTIRILGGLPKYV